MMLQYVLCSVSYIHIRTVFNNYCVANDVYCFGNTLLNIFSARSKEELRSTIRYKCNDY